MLVPNRLIDICNKTEIQSKNKHSSAFNNVWFITYCISPNCVMMPCRHFLAKWDLLCLQNMNDLYDCNWKQPVHSYVKIAKQQNT